MGNVYYFWITERQAEGRRPEMDERIREKPKKVHKKRKNKNLCIFCTKNLLYSGEKM